MTWRRSASSQGVDDRPSPASGRPCRLRDVTLPFEDDRSDKAVAAARHGLAPALAAGRLAQHPAQRRDLNREVALLHGLAGPRRRDQRVLRKDSSAPLDQRAQQGDRSPPERYGLAPPEQQVVLRIQAKWSQRMTRHDGNI